MSVAGHRENAMILPRRQIICFTIAATILTVAQIASAQPYPTRPITLVVPIAAGGAVDTAARIIAEKLQEKLKQSVVVENRPGAGSMIGTNFVARQHLMDTLCCSWSLAPFWRSG